MGVGVKAARIMQNQSTLAAARFVPILRKQMTDGERLLWQKLRGEQLGFKFRRQHPFGAYVSDFACLAPKLIVEIDGSQHAAQVASDAKRDAFFAQHGFEVLRFPANLPFLNMPSLVEAVYQRLTSLAAQAPIPTFPQKGKEQEKLIAPTFLQPGTAQEKCHESDLLLPPLGEGRDGSCLRFPNP